jgi:hypothetical protein
MVASKELKKPQKRRACEKKDIARTLRLKEQEEIQEERRRKLESLVHLL